MTIKQVVEENSIYICSLSKKDELSYEGIMHLYLNRPSHVITSSNHMKILQYWGKREGNRLQLKRNRLECVRLDDEFNTYINSYTTKDNILTNDFLAEKHIINLFKKRKRNLSRVMNLYIEGWSVKDISGKIGMTEKMVSHYVTESRKKINTLMGMDRKSFRVRKYKKIM